MHFLFGRVLSIDMSIKEIKCWLWKVLWCGSLLSLVVVWAAELGFSILHSIDLLFILWNALILAALAITIKLDCHECGVCMSRGRE